MDAIVAAADRGGRRGEPRALAQGRRDALDVGAAAAAHRAPGELRADGEQAMVVEEAHEGLRRIVEHAAKRRRPDAGRHRHQVAVAERRAEPRIVDEVADREVEVLALVEQAGRHPVEAQDVVRHAQEGRPHHVAPLREKAGEGAAVLEAAAIEADRERHVGRLGRHAEMVEQGDQVGIVALVEDDEADIDRLAAAQPRRIDRAGMAAEPALALVDHDIVLAAEQPRRAKTRNAGADDSNFHPSDPATAYSASDTPGAGGWIMGARHSECRSYGVRSARLQSAPCRRVRDARGPSKEHERAGGPRPQLKTSGSSGAAASPGSAGRR